ncbi:MAG: hypothetical protein Q9224_005550, partial [Gallowayella concinna]
AKSSLLGLPLELRILIYIHLFSGQTLDFPDLGHALLSVSKQIRNEALPVYYRHVQFDFESIQHLLDFLATFDRDTISQLGHISVCASPFSAHADQARETHRTCHFDDVLPFLPGLQLLSLKVLDMSHQPGLQWFEYVGKPYRVFENLISCQGYKELIYVIVDGFCMFGPTLHDGNFELRKPQPSTWDAMIKNIDGFDSGAGVDIFQPCGDKLIPVKDYENNQGLGLLEPPHHSIEIHVKRGRGVDYGQVGLNGTLNNPHNEYFPHDTWKDMKARGVLADVMETDLPLEYGALAIGGNEHDYATDEVRISFSDDDGSAGDEDDGSTGDEGNRG